jgi:hypothetical protein
MAVAIFASGVICGAGVVRVTTKARPLGNWNDLLPRVAKRMQRDLDLTEGSERVSNRSCKRISRGWIAFTPALSPKCGLNFNR